MKDSRECIIYVGKAKNLKNRVQSYFYNSKGHSQKVKKLITNIKNFEYILTDTEFEAFMLECKLIQEIKPIYNKKMKSSLSYTYIMIKMDEEHPSIDTTNSPIENDGNLYFGPYTSRNTVERTVLGIKESFKILCSNTKKTNTPCLNYSLGLCIGVCLGGSIAELYNPLINKIIALLNGNDLSILEELMQKMIAAAENFEFEAAAKYRDTIDAINFLLNKEKVIEFTVENNNIAIIENLQDSLFKLILIKRNKILFSAKFNMEETTINQLVPIIKAYFKNSTVNLSNVISRDEIDEAQIIYSYLTSSACRYLIIPAQWLTSSDYPLEEALKKIVN